MIGAVGGGMAGGGDRERRKEKRQGIWDRQN
jgi:hypothetical protein